MIEVTHNIDKLSCRKTVHVKSSRAAYAGLQRLMDVKRVRGMRLRYSQDLITNTIMLEARNTLPIEAACSYLSDAGHLRR